MWKGLPDVLLNYCRAATRRLHSSSVVLDSAEILQDLPVIALVGRPNVGKSALFNRFVKSDKSLVSRVRLVAATKVLNSGKIPMQVHDTPSGHVTRDYREGIGRFLDLNFKAIDTSGLEPSAPGASIQARTSVLTADVLRQCSAAVLLLDARQGVIAADYDVARWLRRLCPPERVILVANKAEGRQAQQGMDELVQDAQRLGFGDPVAISATSGEGMAELYQALQPVLEAAAEQGQMAAVSQPEAAARNREAAYASRPHTGAVAGRRSGSQPGGPGPTSVHPSQAAAQLPDASTAQREAEGEGSVFQHALDDRAEAGPGIELAASQRAGHSQPQMMSVGDAEVVEATGEVTELPPREAASSNDDEGPPPERQRSGAVRVAIMGVPNVGKSTLVNHLLGHQRCLTGPEPGLTRDAVSATLTWRGREVELVDTAGWLSAAAMYRGDDDGEQVTQLAQRASKHALGRAHVVVLVVDALRVAQEGRALLRKEAFLARTTMEEGRALVLVANKVDELTPAQRKAVLQQLTEFLETKFLEAGKLPCIMMSALTGEGARQLLPRVIKVHDRWSQRVSTSRLNAFLEKLALRMVGSGSSSNLDRIKYLTQVSARPPTFLAFLRGIEGLPEDATRFLANSIRTNLDFDGVPIRIRSKHKEPLPKLHGRRKAEARLS